MMSAVLSVTRFFDTEYRWQIACALVVWVSPGYTGTQNRESIDQPKGSGGTGAWAAEAPGSMLVGGELLEWARLKGKVSWMHGSVDK